MTVFINAIIERARDELILLGGFPGTGVIEYLAQALKTGFPEADAVLITNREELSILAEKHAIKYLKIRKNDFAAHEWTFPALVRYLKIDFSDLGKSDDLWILSPCLGIIGENRLKSMASAFDEKKSGVFVSAGVKHRDHHPSWARAGNYSRGYLAGYVDYTPLRVFYRFFNRRKHFDESVLEYFPPYPEIRGSQDIPDLYVADEAITVISSDIAQSGAFPEKNDWNVVITEPEGKHPVMIYRLPVFKMGR